MRRLFYWSFDPQSRFVRLALAEKGLDFDVVPSPPWQPHADVATLAPGAAGVALVHRANEAQYSAIGGSAICEYLEEAGDGERLLPRLAEDRAEARRIWRRVDEGCREACENLLSERIAIARDRSRAPDSTRLRTGSHALRARLTFFNYLAETRSYLAGRKLTLADLALGAHLSCFDYFGDVPWDLAPDLKSWYGRMKSRRSFRPILAEELAGTRPAPHYANLDF